MATLLSILNQKVVPHVSGGSSPSLVVASDSLNSASLPQGVTMSPCKMKGPRKPVKGRRDYGNYSLIAASWEEDHLIEIANAAKLFFVVNGQADMQLGKTLFHCRAGCFVLIPPGVPHSNGTRP